MTTIAGRYEIKELIGEGGMGVVFRAYDPPPLNRDVAIKTLRHEFDEPNALDLFYKECSALKSIAHPNIIEIFDMGEFDESGRRRPFFVMPLLKGQPLDELIQPGRERLTVDRVIEIISQTCRGLQAAHDYGLIHRDVKPSNIFVMPDDSVKIIDFGIAHALSAQSRTMVVGRGTLPYMAPELVENKPVSPQSDIYALGVTLFQALTGELPFQGANDDALAHAILYNRAREASELNPSVTRLVSQVVHKAMAKRSSHRFATAREFGQALRKAAHNEPVFPEAQKQQRILSATRAIEKRDFQLANDIVSELESEHYFDPHIAALRSEIDGKLRQTTIDQLYNSALAREEAREDKLALDKLKELLQLAPGYEKALILKRRIEDRLAEAEIERWTEIARSHLASHAYGRARDAAQKAREPRPNDVRVVRLLKEIDVAEQEYLRVQRQKADLFQSAVTASKSGDISRAFNEMRAVIELEKKAPDPSAQATAVYQSFHDKLWSELEAINAAYGKAKRHLAEKQFAEALRLCSDSISRYPGEGRFHALKSDIEEQQRQQQVRLDQERREAAYANWIRQIDAQLAASNVDNADALIGKALVDFPADAPLLERRKRAHERIERSRRANELATEGQRLCELGQFDKGVELLRVALQLEDRPVIRQTLVTVLVIGGQQLLASDWRTALARIERALALDPRNASAVSLRDQALGRKRDEELAAEIERRSRQEPPVTAPPPSAAPPKPHIEPARDPVKPPEPEPTRGDAISQWFGPYRERIALYRERVPLYWERVAPYREWIADRWEWVASRPIRLRTLAALVALGLVAVPVGSWIFRSDPRPPDPTPIPVPPPAPTPQVASLTLRGLPAGLEVSLDGRRIGTIGGNGALSFSGIRPGRHTLVFGGQPEYEPFTVEREFTASTTLTLSEKDIQIPRAPAQVELQSDEGITIVVSQGNKTIQRLNGPGKVALREGTYDVSAVGPARIPATRKLVVTAGSTRTFDVRTFLVRGIDAFDLTTWAQSGLWFAPRQAVTLSQQSLQNGRVTFTVRRNRGDLLSRSSPIKWVVGQVSSQTRIYLQLDRDNFYRSDIVNGAVRTSQQIAHRIGNDEDVLHLSVHVKGNRLIHQYSVDGPTNWTSLDDWQRTPPSGTLEPGRRTPLEGRFGFVLAPNEELLISNFLYTPESR